MTRGDHLCMDMDGPPGPSVHTQIWDAIASANKPYITASLLQSTHEKGWPVKLLFHASWENTRDLAILQLKPALLML